MYATLSQLRSAAAIPDTMDDPVLTSALAAAEQAIDGYCGRSFGTAGTALSTRVYAAQMGDVVYIDDCTSITLVETDADLDGTWSQTWAAGDWQAEPLNGRAGSLAVPFDRVRAVSDYAFPVSHRAAVRVTATWGWAAVPSVVSQATILTALRYWKRTDTPLGFGGGPDTGLLYVSRQVDGDVANMLAPYRRGLMVVGGLI